MNMIGQNDTFAKYYILYYKVQTLDFKSAILSS